MNIGLLGCGNVGRGVKEIADTQSDLELSIKKILVRRPREDKIFTIDPEEFFTYPGIEAVAEFIGGEEPATTYAMRIMESKKSFVTANKKMLALHLPELIGCAAENGVTLAYEASVGGGIPWITNIRAISEVDEIYGFRGILNGTTNYILTAMEEGKEFADVLAEAQKLGYAEPDPTDDIDGFDTRYKTVISIYQCFGKYVHPDRIPLYGIRHIRKQDMDYADMIGRTIKLLTVCSCRDGNLAAVVMPVMISKRDILANVTVNSNAVILESSNLGNMMFSGQGAGTYPTSHAVIQDLLWISRGGASELRVPEEAELRNDGKRARYYIRADGQDIPEELIDTYIFSGAVVTKEISLDTLTELTKGFDSEDFFVAEIGND